MIKRLVLLMALCSPLAAMAALPVGSIIKPITLSGEAGGRVEGGAWSTDQYQGKIIVLLDVDPDEKDKNKIAVEALAALPTKPYVQSVVVINMDATWLPNSAIQSSLESSQKEHPTTHYAKDMKKALVKWGLGDDSYSISIIDPQGKVRFSYDGNFDAQKVDELVAEIKQAAKEVEGANIDSKPK